MASKKSPPSRYQYWRLLDRDDLRLIRVLPSANSSAQVECELFHSSLDPSHESCQEYEALSYTWGNGNVKSSSIILDSQNFDVTPNLLAALKALRLPQDSRYLWIDAICINQADMEEVSGEVLRMRRIYHEATRVVVWLGESSKTTALAMEHLRYLSQQRRLTASAKVSVKLYRFGCAVGTAIKILLLTFHFFTRLSGLSWTMIFFFYVFTAPKWQDSHILLRWYVYIMKAGVPLCIIVSFIHLPDAIRKVLKYSVRRQNLLRPVATALRDIFLRSWFTRVWVVQEIAVANDAVVICGRYSMPWQEFSAACQQIYHIINNTWVKSAYLDSGYQRAYYIISALNIQGLSTVSAQQKRELLPLLCMFNYLEATHACDKVYSLVGLAIDVRDLKPGVSALVPRYDIELVQVYAEVAKFIVESSGDLRLFCACLGKRTLPDLPSWVPDWKSARVRNVVGMEMRRAYSLPTEFFQPATIAKFAPDLRSVEVQGFTIDHVSGQLQQMQKFTEKPFLMAFFNFFLTPFAHPLSYLIRHGESLTKKAGAWMGVELSKLSREFQCSTSRVEEKIQGDPKVHSLEHQPSPEMFPGHQAQYKFDWKPEFPHLIWDPIVRESPIFKCVGRTWCDEICVGDVICMMVGATLPLVLRKSERDQHWVVKGSCSLTMISTEQAIWDAAVSEHIKGEMPLMSFLLG